MATDPERSPELVPEDDRIIGKAFRWSVLAIVLIVSLVASRIAGSFVKPLGALSHAAKRLSKGEREVEIGETTFPSEEVSVLTRTFNDMSRGLDRHAFELEKSHQAVEAVNDKLVAKNHELSDVNLVLEQLAITDGLTKLHNHRFFQESIAKECKRSLRSKEPLSLILIDIDYFKKWNDRLGHAGGDEILRRLAGGLNQCVRGTDILTRYGFSVMAIMGTGMLIFILSQLYLIFPFDPLAQWPWAIFALSANMMVLASRYCAAIFRLSLPVASIPRSMCLYSVVPSPCSTASAPSFICFPLAPETIIRWKPIRQRSGPSWYCKA